MTYCHYGQEPVQPLPLEPNPASHRGDGLERLEEPRPRIRELEERLARLSEASLRINESLEFDTAPLNATPIRCDEGAVESMVVTLQDMAAVKELELLRVEFLAMAGRELRRRPHERGGRGALFGQVRRAISLLHQGEYL